MAERAHVSTRAGGRRSAEFAFERKAFYAPAEVAKIVGISDQTVLQRIRDGELYAVRLGPRLLRIPLGSLMQFLGAPPEITWTRTVGHVDWRTDHPEDAAEHVAAGKTRPNDK